MSLLLQTTIISLMMIALCCLPIFFKHVPQISRLLFLVGTGALVGIVSFDLMPDVVEMGGNKSLVLVFCVWVIYSIIHLLHYRHHKSHHHSEDENHLHVGDKGITVFLTSMMIHCISSGILLVISAKVSESFSHAVLLSLIAHKCYESLIVSSIVLDKAKTRFNAVLCIVLYSLSFPFGAMLASLFNEQINLDLAIFATSFALGTLLGCMVFDFLIPSFNQIRKRRIELVWVFLGLALTELMMRSH